jgi:hypothetical protein
MDVVYLKNGSNKESNTNNFDSATIIEDLIVLINKKIVLGYIKTKIGLIHFVNSNLQNRFKAFGCFAERLNEIKANILKKILIQFD